MLVLASKISKRRKWKHEGSQIREIFSALAVVVISRIKTRIQSSMASWSRDHTVAAPA